MHQKRKTKKSFWLHEEWLSPQKEQIFCSFLNTFLEKNVICTFCLAKCIRKGQKKNSFWLHEEWLSPHKEQLCCSFLNVIFLEKNFIWTVCLAKCIRKGQQNCSFWLHEEWLSPQKEQLFGSFLNVVFLEKNVICTFCLAKCIRKGPKNCSFWLHEEWLSPQKEQFFCSFLNVIFVEKNVICTFCLAKCIRKGQKKIPFDYMKNGSLHKKSNFLFLSEHHLSRKERHLYFLPCQMHQKRTKNCSFWLHEEWLSLQTKNIFGSFLNIIVLEKNVICTFCLAKCIRKGQQKIVPFDYMKNGSLHKKSNFFSFLNVVFVEKKVICTFCLAKCIRKGKTKFLLTTWRMALPTKRTICLFFSVLHLSRKERHLYFLPCQMHQKRTTKIVPFDYMKNGSLHKKSNFFVPFLMSSC